MKQIGFIAGQDGSVVKYDPKAYAPIPKKPAKPLTRGQKATLYFKALRHIKSLMKSVGFRETTDCGHAAFCIELDNFILEMAVQEAPRIAHVTSYAGYAYDPNKITAKVTMAVVTDNARDYVIRVMATASNGLTSAPTYVVVKADAPDLLKDAFFNCLMAARDFMRRDANIMSKVQAALSKRDIEAEFEKLKTEDPLELEDL